MKWIFILLLTGCASKKLSNYDVLWSDGECILHISNMTLEQAEEIKKDWAFMKCKVDAEIEDSTSKGKLKE